MMKKILICCVACFSIGFSYAQRIPPSRLEKVYTKPPKYPRCYPLLYDRKIGVVYSSHHHLLGIKFHDAVSWKFGVPLMIMADLEYRPRSNGNGYFSADLMRIETIPLGNNHLSVNAGYKRILAYRTSINNQVYVGSSLFEGGISLAYAAERQRVSETFEKYNHGILLQCYREFFDQLEIKAMCIYWFDEFQYSIHLNENAFYSRFCVGFGYERIGKWQEFDIAISYIY